MAPSKVLVIGGTGTLGQHIVNASVKLGHPTFALVRSLTPSDPAKAQLLKSFQDAGVTLLVGDVTDKASLLAALRQVDAVVSAVPGVLAEQINILEAAKEAGTIKRFIPSEFGLDIGKVKRDVPLTSPTFEKKLKIRSAARESGIPYTWMVGFGFASYYFPLNLNYDLGKAPPRDGKMPVYSDGNTKAVSVDEEDIGTFTIKCIDDPRAANKSVFIRPEKNIASQNEVIALWEKKIGHVFEKEFVSGEEVFKSITKLPVPANFFRALIYHCSVRGDMDLPLDPAHDVEATSLFPDVKYATLDEYLDRF
ncbi:unnamed protein product [Calypogeia fissa]